MAEVIYYKDCAEIKGDGVTDDLCAIRALHARANELGAKVVAEDGKRYYLKKTGGKSVVIGTDVDFGTAEFIIDDSDITVDECDRTERTTDVFYLPPKSRVTYSEKDDPKGYIAAINSHGGVDVGQKNVGFAPGHSALIALIDSKHNTYKRYIKRDETNNGIAHKEILLIDADGNIDESTSVIFPFAEVDGLIVVDVDTVPLTLSGGIFTTVATQSDQHGSYIGYSRGFRIGRANVTIENMEHRVVNEGDTGVSYNGFLMFDMSHNTLVRDSKLSGRKYFAQGTYDIVGRFANKMVFRNCTQYNMFNESGEVYSMQEYWGIMGSNGCANIEYYDCVFSRLDAHAGVYNAVVKGCHIRDIHLIGGGTALIEDSLIRRDAAVVLRMDYASSWRGDITVKNCKLLPPDEIPAAILVAQYFDMDFGYDEYLPTNLYIEDVTWDEERCKNGVYAVSVLTKDDPTAEVKYNHLHNIENIVITNCPDLRDGNRWNSGYIPYKHLTRR